jgi:monofunctional glycosyltransferase
VKQRRRRSGRPAQGKAAGPTRRRLRRGSLLRVALRAALCALVLAPLLFWLTLPSLEPLREGTPPVTALMEARLGQAREEHRAARRAFSPVPLQAISPWLQSAVVNSEDARFFLHSGIDVAETKEALQKALETGKLGRGASTLTQQLAKNLWLGEERSLLRKAREAVLATRLEELGKERVLELYLNVAEWGEGVYGAEAAARAWFGIPAAQLGPEQAAVLAAMLPAPRKRNPRRPSARLRTRAFEVLSLYGLYRQLGPEELEAAKARLTALIGPPPAPRRRHAAAVEARADTDAGPTAE